MAPEDPVAAGWGAGGARTDNVCRARTAPPQAAPAPPVAPVGVPQAPVAKTPEALPVGMQHAHVAPVQPPPARVAKTKAAPVRHTPTGQPPAYAVPLQPPEAALGPHVTAGGVPPANATSVPPALPVAGASSGGNEGTSSASGTSAPSSAGGDVARARYAGATPASRSTSGVGGVGAPHANGAAATAQRAGAAPACGTGKLVAPEGVPPAQAAFMPPALPTGAPPTPEDPVPCVAPMGMQQVHAPGRPARAHTASPTLAAHRETPQMQVLPAVARVPFVNRPFASEIHGTVNFTQFCCVLLLTWCYRVLLSCYLRPK